jgi:small subunit ribosomal protein S21
MSDRNEFDLENRQGLYVKVKNNDVNKAMRKLKKMMTSEGIFQELRKREFYEPPSIRKKREKAQAVKRCKKKQAEISENL